MAIPAVAGAASSGLPPAGDQASAVVSGVLTAVGPGDPFAFRGPMNFVIWGSVNTTLTTTNASANASVASGTGLAAGAAVNSLNVPAGTTWATFAGTSGTLALPAITLMANDTSFGGTQVTLAPGSNVAVLLGSTVTVPSNNEFITFPANTTVLSIIQTDIAATPTSPGRNGIINLSAAPTVIPPLKGRHPLRFKLSPNAITTGVDATAVFTGATVGYSGVVQIERSFDGGWTWLAANVGAGTLASFSAGTPVALVFGEPERNVLYRVNCLAYTSGTINYRVSQTGGANESLAIGPLSGG